MISENGQTTDAILYHIAKDLLAFLNGFECLHKAKKQILDRYNIEKHGHYCWPADVIEKAWKETNIMKEKKKQKHWARVIMVQVIRHFICDKYQQNPAQEDSGFVSGTQSTMSRTDEAPSPTEVNSIANSIKHSEDRSSQSTAEQDTMGAPGGVEQHSEGNPQIFSSGQTGGVSQSWTGTPNTVQSQRTGNNPGGFNRQDGPAGALIQTQNNNAMVGETVYICIPRSVMIHNELRVGEQIRNIESPYKLIDRVPETERHSEIKKRKSYVMSFNSQTKNANWVYEILNRNTLPESPVEAEPFGDPYHRGHLAAAANHRWCWEALNDTNLFSNIVPQHKTLNTGPWKSLEEYCRRTAKAQLIRNVHVYSGPIYHRLIVMNPQVIQGKRVPSHFFKVIIEENMNGTVNQPQYYLFPNGNLGNETLRTCVEDHRKINHETEYERDITIEDIQQYSGLTFIAIRPNVAPGDREITVRLQGEDRNADIQITTSPYA